MALSTHDLRRFKGMAKIGENVDNTGCLWLNQRGLAVKRLSTRGYG